MNILLNLISLFLTAVAGLLFLFMGIMMVISLILIFKFLWDLVRGKL